MSYPFPIPKRGSQAPKGHNEIAQGKAKRRPGYAVTPFRRSTAPPVARSSEAVRFQSIKPTAWLTGSKIPAPLGELRPPVGPSDRLFAVQAHQRRYNGILGLHLRRAADLAR